MRTYTHIVDEIPVNAHWAESAVDLAVIEIGSYETGEVGLGMSRAKATELRDALTDLLGEEGDASPANSPPARPTPLRSPTT